MNTVFLLMAEFNSSVVSLDLVAKNYFGVSHEKACQLACKQGFPFPVFRARASQKSPWLVHVNDLAHYLDIERKRSMEEWKHIHNKPWRSITNG